MISRRRWVARARAGGAAMVEAVVVIPTFIILFAASVFAWQLYSAKVTMMADARYKVWTYAISDNCGNAGQIGAGESAGPTVDMTTATLTSWSNGNNAGANTSGGVGAVGSGGTGTLSQSLGSVSYQEGTVLTAAGVLGGFKSNVTTQTTMMCNEPPENGNLMGLASSAFDLLTHW
jgi:hypothetical protein